jgi:hypothetical protein
VVEGPGGVPGQRPETLEIDVELGQRVLDALEVTDGLAELDALLGELRGERDLLRWLGRRTDPARWFPGRELQLLERPPLQEVRLDGIVGVTQPLHQIP